MPRVRSSAARSTGGMVGTLLVVSSMALGLLVGAAPADKEVRSSHLQLFAVRTDLAEAARLVDVSLAEGTWSEQQVTFNTLPQVATPPLSTAAVYGANIWYSWDLTPGVV